MHIVVHTVSCHSDIYRGAIYHVTSPLAILIFSDHELVDFWLRKTRKVVLCVLVVLKDGEDEARVCRRS